MVKHVNAPTIAPPFSRYSHAVEAPAGARWLYVSGQVGVAPDGSTEKGFEAQARRAWSNVIAILSAAGMGVGDLVRANVYLTRAGDVAAYRTVRDDVLAGAQPASTLVIVAQLARAEWLIEVEAVAARS